MDDFQFRQLLKWFGFSWQGYRKVRKGVKKRITRNMQQVGCRNMADYLHELENNPELREECERLMTVSISRFFRDRELWQMLRQKILPKLIEKEKESIRVWSAGCASGEEVYTFRILWNELEKSVRYLPKLNLIGTDMNPVYLSRAKEGLYPSASLREVEKEFSLRYFDTKGKHYAVKSELKKDIRWICHHLLSDNPPGSDFHIIFLRNNVLTYYEEELKKEAFQKILKSLAPFGYLIIGSHERLPSETDELLPLLPCAYLFQKQISKQS